MRVDGVAADPQPTLVQPCRGDVEVGERSSWTGTALQRSAPAGICRTRPRQCVPDPHRRDICCGVRPVRSYGRNSTKLRRRVRVWMSRRPNDPPPDTDRPTDRRSRTTLLRLPCRRHVPGRHRRHSSWSDRGTDQLIAPGPTDQEHRPLALGLEQIRPRHRWPPIPSRARSIRRADTARADRRRLRDGQALSSPCHRTPRIRREVRRVRHRSGSRALPCRPRRPAQPQADTLSAIEAPCPWGPHR
jgi:hypothetical protein